MGDRVVCTWVNTSGVSLIHAIASVNAMHLSQTRAHFARSQPMVGVVRTRVNTSGASLIQASASCQCDASVDEEKKHHGNKNKEKLIKTEAPKAWPHSTCRAATPL